jgi:hypothetical protein
MAFRLTRQRRHPGEITFSRLNTRPAPSPVNASTMTLRSSSHDSGPTWLATPSSHETFIHCTSPALPAHRVPLFVFVCDFPITFKFSKIAEVAIRMPTANTAHMLALDGNELVLLKGAGGEHFTRFVDGLIRGEAHVGGLSQSEVDTQVRVNIRDGGVDTRVNAPIPRDRTGYMDVPTCWQFKAQTAMELEERKTEGDPFRFLTEEVSKPEVRRLVELGYGYRFCFLGDLPPEKLAKWEDHLAAECRKMSPASTTPRVVAADKLTAWANRFPAVASMVRPFTQEIFNLDSWRQAVRAVTPEYVPFDGWANFSKSIGDHVTDTLVVDACLSVEGEAGVGKTRLVFESLTVLPGIPSLVMYTNDERTAHQLSYQLATAMNAPAAIVVADECSLPTRLLIEETIVGCRERVRFICLSNSGERGVSRAAELWLEEMPRATIERVLARNFPNVPQERRAAYAELAGGFIRLAADMCRHNNLMAEGDLGPILNRIEEYVRARVRDADDLRVLHQLALFSRVGAKADVAHQLQSLCEITGIPRETVLQVAGRIKDSPGFVNVAGRFLYVTPAIVARIAFARGFDIWVRDDPKAFVERLHPDLVSPFFDRVRVVATEEVKAAVAATFREWIATRSFADLTDHAQVKRLAVFVEADPNRYLPLLKTLVVGAPPDVLNTRSHVGSGARRELVWLCERLAAFPNLYGDSEAILFRLAAHESEPSIGNNATGIWRQLQRPLLSGSSVSYAVRFQILKRRIEESDGPDFELCLKGLSSIFASHVSRMGAPATVAGKLRPEDWKPKDNSQLIECWIMALGLFRQLTAAANGLKSGKAIDVIIENLYAILHAGFAMEVKPVFNNEGPASIHRAQIIETIDTFLQRESERTAADGVADGSETANYYEEIRSWRQSIMPSSLEGRIRVLISRDQWHESLRGVDGNVNPVVVRLAKEALDNPQAVEKELRFLMSDAAKAASAFGSALGQIDRNEVMLPIIHSAIGAGTNISFAQGYVHGLLRATTDAATTLRGWIETIEATDVRAGLCLRAMGGDKLAEFNYALKAVDQGQVEVSYLSRFGYLRPTADRVREILRRFVAALPTGNEDVRRSAFGFLNAVWHLSPSESQASSIEDDEVRSLAWTVLESSEDLESRDGGYQRAEILEKLAKYNPKRVSAILVGSLMVRGYGNIHDHATRVLVGLAPEHPSEVMESLGKGMMDSERGISLFIGDAITLIIRATPANVVIEWVRRMGNDAARAIARKLPLPFLDKAGQPIVPEVTLALLREFGSDEEVCVDFVSGSFRSDSWWGNGGDHFKAKAAVARQFLSHEDRCVRRWAEVEVQHCEQLAESEQRRYEERMLD